MDALVRVTVDLDSKSRRKLNYYLKIANQYGFKPIYIRETKNGFHICYFIPQNIIDNIDWFKPKRFRKHIIKCLIRLEKAQIIWNIPFNLMRIYILRLILGDDIARIFMDMRRRRYLPEQVLFKTYKVIKR